jgi:2-phosphosulfolactate phosphatase
VVADYLIRACKPVILGCAAWKDRVNLEDMLFAGAIIQKVKQHFDINCDSSRMAEAMYQQAQNDIFGFMKTQNASHYQRLMGFGLESDIRYCLSPDNAPVLPYYSNGRLMQHTC